jgi:predicted dehydrogenase
MQLPVLDLNYHPQLPEKTDYGIGIIGCGGIVNYAHLPAYRTHNLRILACHDRNPAAADSTAAAHGIPQVYEDLDALLANPAIEIVDIAVPAWEQRVIAERALAAGKHLLCQKPLAETLADARAIQAAAETHRRLVAVNQQMRWSPLIAAARDLIANGWIGQPTDAQINVSVTTPWHMWPWLRDSERLEVMYHSIHYLDSMRALFGNPEWLTSRHSRYPGQLERAETKTITILDYASGLQVLVAVNHHDHTTAQHATLRILGTEGVISGTIGLLYNYPHGQPDTLRLVSSRYGSNTTVDLVLEGTWIPGAFIGPMAGLMAAIQHGQQPPTSAADNIGTLQLVHAAYRSAIEHCTLRPAAL